MWYFLSPVWCQWAKKSWGVPQGCSFIVYLANPSLLFFPLPLMHFYFVAFVIFTDHACLFFYWNYFRPFVSSIMFLEVNAGNMDIKPFIIILPLNDLAWRLVMKKIICNYRLDRVLRLFFFVLMYNHTYTCMYKNLCL